MSRYKVLVVDDEPVNCKLLREFLEDVANCDTVQSGEQAVNMFEMAFKTDNRYDLVLLDIAMPEMDGLEVLEKIRAFEEENGLLLGKGVKIIMITAIKEAFMTAFKRGAEDYILKPVDQDILLNKIEEQLGS